MNVGRDTYSTDMWIGGAQAIFACVLFIAIYILSKGNQYKVRAFKRLIT